MFLTKYCDNSSDTGWHSILGEVAFLDRECVISVGLKPTTF